MKLYIYCIILFVLLALPTISVNAQGCVAVKNMSSCSVNWGDENVEGLQVSLNYRYFRSYKHFVGSDEQEERVENGTEVINNDNSVNLGLNYTFNKKWSATLIVPFVYIDRSSLYEHLGNGTATNPDQLRFHTQSQGLGDVRAIGYYNALGEYAKGGLTLGLGIKAPTGKYDAKDYFHKPEGLVKNVVDQSIQPGDGGFGIITEFDFAHMVKGNVFAYAQGMYMLSPRNTNGVKRSSNLSTNPTTGEEIANSNEFSVPDQYMLRIGGRYMVKGIQASLGGRMECIPSKDLIGKSEGFRRPGYIISVEPSAFYTVGAHTFGFNLPVALARNRTRSQIDIARGNNPATGKPFHGDAAFADWLISLTYAYKIAH
jgi:hypothetical protein